MLFHLPRLLSLAAVCACALAGPMAHGAADKTPPAPPEIKEEELLKRPADYQPSGDPYDWTRTRAPERPYMHKYDQSIIMKVQMSEPDPEGGCKIHYKFDRLLKDIERLDGITCGANKILFLAGWQAGGDNRRAPAWDLVNPQLKGADDKTALEGLRRVMDEARKFHTSVSLVLNMSDAFEDSPLWQAYLDQGVVAKDKDGKPLKGDMIDGAQAYRLSYAKEWETGLAKKRIDALLKAIPELYECKRSPINQVAYGHAIFLEGFRTLQAAPAAVAPVGDANRSVFDDAPPPVAAFEGISPFLGYSYAKEMEGQRKTFRYFRDWGIDVICDESTIGRIDPFVGLQPAAWHFKIPFKGDPAKEPPPWIYCGTPMRLIDELKKEERDWDAVRAQFALKAAPWIYEHWYRAENNDKRPANWDKMYDAKTGDVCVPMPWWKGKIDDQHPYLAFSQKGTKAHEWELDKDWKNTQFVNVIRVTSNGKQVKYVRLQVNARKFYLEARGGEMFVVMPE